MLIRELEVPYSFQHSTYKYSALQVPAGKTGTAALDTVRVVGNDGAGAGVPPFLRQLSSGSPANHRPASNSKEGKHRTTTTFIPSPPPIPSLVLINLSLLAFCACTFPTSGILPLPATTDSRKYLGPQTWLRDSSSRPWNCAVSGADLVPPTVPVELPLAPVPDPAAHWSTDQRASQLATLCSRRP